MSELWMFLATLAVGGAFLCVAQGIFRTLDEASLRVGLWMHGIVGDEAERVIRFHKTGKLDR